MKTDDISEETIKSCIKGDRRAQKALYDTLSPILYTLCRKYAPCDDDAQEWLQIGFIKAFKSLGTYSFRGSFEGWMRKLFVNTCLSEIKNKKKYIELGEAMKIENSPSGYMNLTRKDLELRLSQIPPGQRRVIQLFASGYKHKEIALILGITESTSKSQYCRGQRFINRKEYI